MGTEVMYCADEHIEIFNEAIRMLVLLYLAKKSGSNVRKRNYRRRKAGMSPAFKEYWAWMDVYLLVLVAFSNAETDEKLHGQSRVGIVVNALNAFLMRINSCVGEEIDSSFSNYFGLNKKIFNEDALKRKVERARKFLARNSVSQVRCEWSPEIRVTIFRQHLSKESAANTHENVLGLISSLRSSNYLLSEQVIEGGCKEIAIDKNWSTSSKRTPRVRVRWKKPSVPGAALRAPSVEVFLRTWLECFFPRKAA